MTAMSDPMTDSLYPTHWPEVPFHSGELQVQKRLGVHDSVMTYGPRVIRPHMPDQHREFYRNQPFLVVAARDSRDKMWSTLFFASSQQIVDSFIQSPTPRHLVLDSQPLPGDALQGALHAGSDLGILGIEFSTRRRNRVNGRVARNDGNRITFQVDQSFGNCPQYIKPRDWWTETSFPSSSTCAVDIAATNMSTTSRPNRLSNQQIYELQKAETIFVATGYRGEGEDPRFGNDASHRGGTAGFLKISQDGRRIFLPDYAGNNMYMSLGNLVEDGRMGMTVPLFETGGMIQMTGLAVIHWEDSPNVHDEVSVADFPGALRWLEFIIDEIVELPPGSLPIRWDAGNDGIQLQVFDKIDESEDVTSFYLAPLKGGFPKWKHLPGQHLTLTLPIDSEETITRSYSISSYQPLQHQQGDDMFYRISVRRDPFGVGSTFLHDNIKTGDLLTVQQPSGAFHYRPKNDGLQDRTVLFLSAGIGVTPVLSMLHAFVNYDTPDRHGKAIWVHSARNPRQHVFRQEVELLRSKVNDDGNAQLIETFVTYTRRNEDDHDDDVSSTSSDFHGRIDAAMMNQILLQANVVDRSKLDVYMCGPTSFVGSVEEILDHWGVGSIQYETF